MAPKLAIIDLWRALIAASTFGGGVAAVYKCRDGRSRTKVITFKKANVRCVSNLPIKKVTLLSAHSPSVGYADSSLPEGAEIGDKRLIQ